MAGAVRKVGCEGWRVGGYRDHVHLIAGLHSSVPHQERVQRVKICGTRRVMKQRPEPGTFSWQTGYAAFSINPSNLRSQLDCVERQERLHDLRAFPAGYLDLLVQHGIRDEPEDASWILHHGSLEGPEPRTTALQAVARGSRKRRRQGVPGRS